MLRNDADARRCSYFELGLPMMPAEPHIPISLMPASCLILPLAKTLQDTPQKVTHDRAVFTWLSKGIGFGFGFTTPFGWLVYLLWFWFYDSQVKTALYGSASD